MMAVRILKLAVCAFIFACISVPAESPSNTLLTKKEPFSRNSMEKTYQGTQNYGLLHRARFSMSQSYSTSMTFSGGGSHSSGLYLNTLGYQIADPLLFTIDLGIHSPFHATGIYQNQIDPQNLENNTSFVVPRMSLEYRPSDNTSLSLHLINGRDAYKTYGPFGRYGWSSPFE